MVEKLKTYMKRYKKQHKELNDRILEFIEKHGEFKELSDIEREEYNNLCYDVERLENQHAEKMIHDQCIYCCKYTSVRLGAIYTYYHEFGYGYYELICPKCQMNKE
ncbi:MAG: hypothetical protein ACTSR3_01335 [Candidatus Helarchaeota archaeon]